MKKAAKRTHAYCDEHLEHYTELVEDKSRESGFHCPHCGKFKWPAFDGIRAYDEKLIRGPFAWNKT